MLGFLAFLIQLGLIIAVLAGFWKVFEKAGQPGWAALVPIYNLYVLLLIVKKPWWWLILFFIPIANLVMAIIVIIALAKCFGKSGGFVVGMILLPFIFYPILGFGDASFREPVA